MSVISQIIDNNTNNKYEENIAITDLHMNVDPRDFGAASFSADAIDSLVRYGEEEVMRHWDDIIALKKRIGIDESFRPTIFHPLWPKVMTETTIFSITSSRLSSRPSTSTSATSTYN